MNMREYSTLHLDLNSSKGEGFYCCSTFHSHSMVFNNGQHSYPIMTDMHTCNNIHLKIIIKHQGQFLPAL